MWGIWAEPSGVVEVLDHNGRSLWKDTVASRLVLSQEIAYIVTNMLEGVIQKGTGKAASSLPYSLAGKTGTTEDSRDALFVGYSPTIVTAVWVGKDSGDSLGDKETGARAALPIWREIMGKVLQNATASDFELPDNITIVRMDERSGMLADGKCAEVAEAAFVKGTEPTEQCPDGRDRQLEKFR